MADITVLPGGGNIFGSGMPNGNTGSGNLSGTNSSTDYPTALDPGSISANLGAWLTDPRFYSDDKFTNAFYHAFGIAPNGRYEANMIAKKLLGPEFYNLMEQYGLYNSLAPLRTQAVNSAIQYLTNPDRAATEEQSRINATQGSITSQVLQRLKQQGAGIGAEAGAAQQGANNAATAGNQFRAQMNSPQGRLGAIQNLLATIQGTSPNLNNLTGLNSIQVGTPRNQTGLGTIAGIVGGLMPGLGAGLGAGLAGGLAGGAGGLGLGVGSGIGAGMGNIGLAGQNWSGLSALGV